MARSASDHTRHFLGIKPEDQGLLCQYGRTGSPELIFWGTRSQGNCGATKHSGGKFHGWKKWSVFYRSYWRTSARAAFSLHERAMVIRNYCCRCSFGCLHLASLVLRRIEQWQNFTKYGSFSIHVVCLSHKASFSSCLQQWFISFCLARTITTGSN